MPELSTAAAEWIAEHAPDAGAVQRAVDDVLAAHRRWDSLPEFRLLARKGDRLVTPVTVILDPLTDPDEYSRLLFAIASKRVRQLRAQHPSTPPIVACLLRVELVNIEVDENPSADELTAISERRIGELDDHDQALAVLAADIRGRVWFGAKDRGKAGAPDAITAAGEQRATGGFTNALRDAMTVPPLVYAADAPTPPPFWLASKGRARA